MQRARPPRANNAGWERARQRHPHHHGIDDAPPTWLPTPPRCGQHTLRPLQRPSPHTATGAGCRSSESGPGLNGTRSPALTPRGVGTASDRSLRPRNPRCVRRSPEAHVGPRPVPGLLPAPAQAAGSLALPALPVRLRRPPQLEPHVESRHDGVQRTAAAAGGAPGRRRAGTSEARACRRRSGTAHPGRRGRPGGGAPPSTGEGGGGPPRPARGRSTAEGGAGWRGHGSTSWPPATGTKPESAPARGHSVRGHLGTPKGWGAPQGGRSGPPPTGSGRLPPPVTAGHDGGEEEGEESRG